MEKSYYKSSIGNLEICCESNKLISLKLVNKTETSAKESPLIKNIKLQLDEYFTGKRKSFDINVNPTGTEFQKKVWKELQNTPYGKTKSYSDIAKTLGNKNAQRAIGNACNKNPILIIIPCHRIISKNGNVGGFACGVSVKQKLLEIENKFVKLF